MRDNRKLPSENPCLSPFPSLSSGLLPVFPLDTGDPEPLSWGLYSGTRSAICCLQFLGLAVFQNSGLSQCGKLVAVQAGHVPSAPRQVGSTRQ